MFNSGVFVLRNTQWGREFLNKTVDLLAAPMPYSYQHNNWHEQSPFMYLSLVPSLLNLDTIDSYSGAITSENPENSKYNGAHRALGYDPDHVLIVPQGWMNSYPGELVQQTQHGLKHHGYTEGDYVVSFNGCGSVLGGEVCLDMFGAYFEESMARGGKPMKREEVNI